MEPLDDGDIDSFFDLGAGVETDFRPVVATTLVSVPAGGASGEITIAVTR